jgi:hypothetical protein
MKNPLTITRNVVLKLGLSILPFLIIFIGKIIFIDTDWRTDINVLLKRNSIYILSLALVIHLFVFFIFITRIVLRIAGVAVCVFGIIYVYINTVFYVNYQEKIVRSFNDRYFLISCFEPSIFPFCDRYDKVIKKEWLFAKNLYSFQCQNYQLIKIDKDGAYFLTESSILEQIKSSKTQKTVFIQFR